MVNTFTKNRHKARRAVRQPVVLWFVVFLISWFISLDQTLFFGAFFAWIALNHGRLLGAYVLPTWIVYPAASIVILGAAAVLWSDHQGNALRTAVVWGTGAIAAVVYFNAELTIRRKIASLLLTVWLASLAAYATFVVFPNLAEAVLSAKIVGPFSSSRQFSTSSQFFQFEVLRPIGFALYANELALYGVLATALFLSQYPELSRRWRYTLLTLSVVGLILSTSRSILLTYLVIATITTIVRPARSRNRGEGALMRGLAVMFVVLVVVGIRPQLIAAIDEWLNGLTEARVGGSADLRELSYTHGEVLFSENLWTGVGGLPQQGPIQIGSHSLPLSIGVRHGLTGILPLLVYLGAASLFALMALTSRDPAETRLATAVLVAVVSSVTIQFDDDILSLLAFTLVATELMRRNYNEKGFYGENIGTIHYSRHASELRIPKKPDPADSV